MNEARPGRPRRPRRPDPPPAGTAGGPRIALGVTGGEHRSGDDFAGVTCRQHLDRHARLCGERIEQSVAHEKRVVGDEPDGLAVDTSGLHCRRIECGDTRSGAVAGTGSSAVTRSSAVTGRIRRRTGGERKCQRGQCQSTGEKRTSGTHVSLPSLELSRAGSRVNSAGTCPGCPLSPTDSSSPDCRL